jgi:hypothetical protein
VQQLKYLHSRIVRTPEEISQVLMELYRDFGIGDCELKLNTESFKEIYSLTLTMNRYSSSSHFMEHASELRYFFGNGACMIKRDINLNNKEFIITTDDYEFIFTGKIEEFNLDMKEILDE